MHQLFLDLRHSLKRCTKCPPCPLPREHSYPAGPTIRGASLESIDMPQLRFVLAWLIMLAIPLQGLAAASMAFCAGEHHAFASRQEARSDGAHDHASHAHVAEQSFAQAFLQSDDHAADPDTGHKCGVCATCCHSPALTEHRPWPELSALDEAVVTAPFVVILTVSSRLPDKPPRA